MNCILLANNGVSITLIRSKEGISVSCK
jgi:hypothetical protein